MTAQAVDVGRFLVDHGASTFLRRWGQQWVIFGACVSPYHEDRLHLEFLHYMTGTPTAVCKFCLEPESLHSETEAMSCRADLTLEDR